MGERSREEGFVDDGVKLELWTQAHEIRSHTESCHPTETSYATSWLIAGGEHAQGTREERKEEVIRAEERRKRVGDHEQPRSSRRSQEPTVKPEY